MEAYDGWSALGDPTRRRIFERLTQGPSSVGAIARELPVSQPAVSQHLKVLKAAHLVVDRAAGNQRIYQINPEGLAALRGQLDLFWTQALSTYARFIEELSEEDQ